MEAKTDEKHTLNCSSCEEEHIKKNCPLYLAGTTGVLKPEDCLVVNAMISKVGCATHSNAKKYFFGLLISGAEKAWENRKRKSG